MKAAERRAYMAALVCPAGCTEVNWPHEGDRDTMPTLIHHRECPSSRFYRPPHPVSYDMDPTMHSPTYEHELDVDLEHLHD